MSTMGTEMGAWGVAEPETKLVPTRCTCLVTREAGWWPVVKTAGAEGATWLTGWGTTAPAVYWWAPAGEWVVAPTMLGATLWLAVAAISALVCASWGLAQALAKMKESATKGFITATSYPLCLSRAP